MSGPSRLSTRDLERLSATLDGQLAPGEAAGMEARLQDDSALRETLEGLRQTKAALRSLPSLRPPRSFTLTPQMVGIRPRRPAYPALRLATAIATVAFMIVTGLDVLTQGLSRFALGAAAPAPAAEQVMLGAAPELEGTAVEESPPLERSVAGETPTTLPALQAFAEDAQAATPTSPVGYGGGMPSQETQAGTPDGIGGGGPLPTPAPGVGYPPSETPTATPTPTPTPTPTRTPTPTPTPQPVAAEPQVRADGGVSGLGPIQWVELLLGAAVVTFAVFSLWFRRES